MTGGVFAPSKNFSKIEEERECSAENGGKFKDDDIVKGSNDSLLFRALWWFGSFKQIVLLINDVFLPRTSSVTFFTLGFSLQLLYSHKNTNSSQPFIHIGDVASSFSRVFQAFQLPSSLQVSFLLIVVSLYTANHLYNYLLLYNRDRSQSFTIIFCQITVSKPTLYYIVSLWLRFPTMMCTYDTKIQNSFQ